MSRVPPWTSTLPSNGSTVALTIPMVLALALTRLWAVPFIIRLAVDESLVGPDNPIFQRLLRALPAPVNPEVDEGAPITVSPASTMRAKPLVLLPPLL